MMRDIFAAIAQGQPHDPMEAARRAMRPPLRRRFYQRAHVADAREGFAVLLDGKPVRTPARRALAAPSRALAQAIAEEWNAQGREIDPARMPLTRLANAVIDAVAASPAAVAADIEAYLGSDLVCYRAEAPAELVARQAAAFDPVLDWARDTFGARFTLTQGVVHVAQPPEAVAAARASIPDDGWRLGALAAITALTGSALIALALAHGALDADAAWAAAHVDEDWQMAHWGRDALAMERRNFRRGEFDAAVTVLRLVP